MAPTEKISNHDTILATLIEWSGIQGHDAECGSATEGAGWAALFRDVTADEGVHKEEGTKSYILYCDTSGFYSYDTFDTSAEAEKHWKKVQFELVRDFYRLRRERRERLERLALEELVRDFYRLRRERLERLALEASTGCDA